jgi:hypothetical protein
MAAAVRERVPGGAACPSEGGLAVRNSKLPVRYQRYVGEAARALADLYEALGKPEKAAAWREKKD